jgi:hypothetical protein
MLQILVSTLQFGSDKGEPFPFPILLTYFTVDKKVALCFFSKEGTKWLCYSSLIHVPWKCSIVSKELAWVVPPLYW